MRRLILAATMLLIMAVFSDSVAVAARWMKPEEALKKAKKNKKWVFVFVGKDDDKPLFKLFAKLNVTSSFLSTVTRSGCLTARTVEGEDDAAFYSAPSFLWYDSEGKVVFSISDLPYYRSSKKGDKVYKWEPRLKAEAILIGEIIKMYKKYKASKKTGSYNALIRYLITMSKNAVYKKFKVKGKGIPREPKGKSDSWGVRVTTLSSKDMCRQTAKNLLQQVEDTGKNFIAEGDTAYENEEYQKANKFYAKVVKGFSGLPEIIKIARKKMLTLRKDPAYLKAVEAEKKTGKRNGGKKEEDDDDERDWK